MDLNWKAAFRPAIDWVKAVVLKVACDELVAEASEAAGYDVAPPEIPLLEAPKKSSKRK